MADATMAFDHPNVGWVLDRIETVTVRYDWERDTEPGDYLELTTPGGVTFAHATVTKVVDVPLRHAQVSLKSMGDHPSEGVFDLLERLNRHYDDDIHIDDEVTIIAFDLLDGDADG